MIKHKIKFSLIELMVVASVLLILSSIFFPSLSRALRASQSLTCLEHQKVIGQAVSLYVEDYTRFPLWKMARSNAVDPKRQHTVFWDDLLGMGYDGRNLTQSLADKGSLFGDDLKGASIYECPLDNSDGRTVSIPSSKTHLNRLQREGGVRSYSLNSYRSGPNLQDHLKEGVAGIKYQTMEQQGVFLTWSQLSHKIEDPSDMFLLVESPGWGFVGAGGSAIRNSPLSQDSQGEANYLQSLGAQINRFENIRYHNGGWNYLFVDGHVENMLPEDTISDIGDLSNPRGSFWSSIVND